MLIHTSKSDIVWNYLGSILNIGMGIFILPVVLRMLSSEELGLWYVFLSIGGLANLVDFGFSPTIMRNITYSWCGAKKLNKEGIVEYFNESKPNYALLKSLVEVSRIVYFMLSIFAGVLLATGGSYYINTILHEKEVSYLIAWFIYAGSFFINLYYSYWSPLLRGIGAIKQSNQVMVISKTVYILIAIVGLLLGGGLIILSIAFLLSGFLMLLLSKNIFMKVVGNEYHTVDLNDEYKVKNLFLTIWPNSKKIGIVTVGAWLITRSSTLLCSTFLGLDMTAKYGLSLQLFGLIGSFSSLLFNSYIPAITESKLSGNQQRYMKLFSRAMIIQWITGVIGIWILVVLGAFALKLIGSNATLLPVEMMVVVGIILFLEWNHSTFATLITLSNTVPFVNASIFSGIGIVMLSIILLKYTQYGIWSLVLSQGIIQMAFNNWYWPRMICKENDTSIAKIIRMGIVEIKNFLYNR